MPIVSAGSGWGVAPCPFPWTGCRPSILIEQCQLENDAVGSGFYCAKTGLS